MANYTAFGPALFYLGPDPVSGLDQVIKIESIAINAGIRYTWGSNAVLAGVPDTDAVARMSPDPAVVVTMNDISVDQLSLITGLTKSTSGSDEAFGLGSSFTRILPANQLTGFVLPLDQSADGVGAANGWWFPKCFGFEVSGITFGRPSPNAETQQFAQVTFKPVYTETSQAGTAIPEPARIGFQGPPSVYSLTWAIN